MVYEWENLPVFREIEARVQKRLNRTRFSLVGIAYADTREVTGALIVPKPLLTGLAAVDIWMDISGDASRYHDDALTRYRASFDAGE